MCTGDIPPAKNMSYLEGAHTCTLYGYLPTKKNVTAYTCYVWYGRYVHAYNVVLTALSYMLALPLF